MNDTQVAIKIGKKTVKILKGRKAEAALKAIQLVLDETKAHKRIKIDIIDTGLPKNFRYGQALLKALEHNLENPIEIADYIIKKLEKTKNSS